MPVAVPARVPEHERRDQGCDDDGEEEVDRAWGVDARTVARMELGDIRGRLIPCVESPAACRRSTPELASLRVTVVDGMDVGETARAGRIRAAVAGAALVFSLSNDAGHLTGRVLLAVGCGFCLPAASQLTSDDAAAPRATGESLIRS